MATANPSERELDILKVLWRIGESRVRDIHAELCSEEECSFSTVQTILRIMAGKGLVSVRAERRALHYKPVYSIEQATSRFLHRLFDGAVDEFVLNMVQAEEMSSDEMRVLEKMLAKARRAKLKEEKQE